MDGNLRTNLRQSVEDLTFGTPERLVGLVAWRVLDSMISTVPSGICLVATWILMQPVIQPGASLDTKGLWCCVCVLVVQAVETLPVIVVQKESVKAIQHAFAIFAGL